MQKLVRTGFGTNNVDHCTRLCHASSVAALLENIGSRPDIFQQRGDGGGVAQACAMVDIVGAEPGAHQLLHQIGFFIRALGHE